MKKIIGEFCPPRAPTRSAWIALAAMAACSVAVWIALAVQSMEIRGLRAETRRLEMAAAEAMRQRQGGSQYVPPWDASARLMLEQATMGWPQVLTILETVQRNGIVPVSLGISVPSRTATVELQFSDYAALLEYIEQLNAADPRMRWRLLQAQSDGGMSGASRPSRATVSATLTPARKSRVMMR